MSNAHKASVIANYAFLALLGVLALTLIWMGQSFIHAVILGLLLGTFLFPIHKQVSRTVSTIGSTAARLPGTQRPLSLILWKFFQRQTLRLKLFRRRNAHLQPLVRLALQPLVWLTGAPARYFRAAWINRDLARAEHRHRLCAGLSVLVIVLGVAIPLLFLGQTLWNQSRTTIDKAIFRLQHREQEGFVTELYQSSPVQNALVSVRKTGGGEQLYLMAVRFLQSPIIAGTLHGITHEAETALPNNQQIPPLDSPTDSARPLPPAFIPPPPTQHLTPELHLPSQSLSDTDPLLPAIAALEKQFLGASRHILLAARQVTNRVLLAAASLAFNLFIMLIVLFFVFYKGDQLYAFSRQVSPLAPEDHDRFANKVRDTANTVFLGFVGAALVQSFASMIAYRIVGLPALLLSTLTAFCAVIPFVGTGLVWGPAALYLLCTGHPGAALFILAWGVVVVGNIDGLVRPWLMSGGKANLSFGVLFFSILGGLRTFGLIGILYGPLLAGLFITGATIFAEKYKRD